MLCFSGNAFQPKETVWPVKLLKERRKDQNNVNDLVTKNVTDGRTHTEENMKMVGQNDARLCS